MEETKVGTTTSLNAYLASDKRGKTLLDIWDKTKREVALTAYDKWTGAAKSQGKEICDMHKARDRAEKNAISTPQALPHKQKAVDTLKDRNFALAVILEKDREEKHTYSKAKIENLKLSFIPSLKNIYVCSFCLPHIGLQ